MKVVYKCALKSGKKVAKEKEFCSEYHCEDFYNAQGQ